MTTDVKKEWSFSQSISQEFTSELRILKVSESLCMKSSLYDWFLVCTLPLKYDVYKLDRYDWFLVCTSPFMCDI